MHEAYSHELSSAGYWPGGAEEGIFYSYAYPEPPGFAEHRIEVDGAFYDHQLNEFVLAYRAVRSSDEPDTMLLSFLQATYDAAASTGGWDRASLERAAQR